MEQSTQPTYPGDATAQQGEKKRRWRLRLPFPLLLLVTVLFTALCLAGLQRLQFHRFTDALFREEMQSDTLSMHYVLANPEAYGIPGDQASLPVYSKASQEESYRLLEQYEKSSQGFCSYLMGNNSRQFLSLLTRQIQDQLREKEFPYYAEPLSPSSGVQSSLPILLAEYTFRNCQDVENYLSLLSSIPDYLDGIAAYEKEKAAAGLFMSDAAADSVIDQCYEIMDVARLTDDTHFLNTTFARRLQSLAEEGLLTPTRQADYLEQNHRLLLECVQPAYESLGDQILLLKGGDTNENGLAHFPAGKEYYAYLLQQATGSDRSIPDMEKMLAARLKHDTAELSRLLQTSPQLSRLSPEDLFPAMTPRQCLEDLQEQIKKDFPPMPKSAPLTCTVKDVDPSLENYCSPAFYLTPPIDDTSENSIYINQKDNPDPLELYTTLAHEGYPGHLYQTVYSQLYRQEKHFSPAYSLLHYGGYSEGWALYVEMRSYDYAKQLPLRQDAGEDADAFIDAIRLNRSIQLCLYTLLDLEIHYDGANFAQISKALAAFGITDQTVAKNIFDYIVQEPANYPKYYIGYLEFEMLRDAAQENWGNAYSDIRFHKLILETGPCPFDVLWKKIDAPAP